MINNETHFIAKQNFTATKTGAASQLPLSCALSVAHTVCDGMFLSHRLYASEDKILRKW